MVAMVSPHVVFCDFDGTITAVETFVGMLKTLTPELSAQLMPQMYNRTLSLRDGVRQLLESIPSRRGTEIRDYALAQPLRPGFHELMDFLDERGIPLVVISGGVRPMVEAVLAREGLGDRIAGVYAVDLDDSQDYLQVISPYESEGELLAKARVMAEFASQTTIAIGDSVTDINMALQADWVFARDRLQTYLDTEGKPYFPWSDFFEIRDQIQKLLPDYNNPR
jgi:2-hydroxy-3-keto-5-methylthiopentenyl-1-phosphate phosphatase